MILRLSIRISRISGLVINAPANLLNLTFSDICTSPTMAPLRIGIADDPFVKFLINIPERLLPQLPQPLQQLRVTGYHNITPDAYMPFQVADVQITLLVFEVGSPDDALPGRGHAPLRRGQDADLVVGQWLVGNETNTLDVGGALFAAVDVESMLLGEFHKLGDVLKMGFLGQANPQGNQN
jgi:hypothetical protein